MNYIMILSFLTKRIDIKRLLDIYKDICLVFMMQIEL